MRFFYFFILFSTLGISAQNRIPVVYATAKVVGQPGDGIDKAIDGDLNTMYHSKYDLAGVPNTFDFYMPSGTQNLNKITYRARKSGLNGVFKTVKITYTTTADPQNYIAMPGGNAGVFTWAEDNTDKSVSLTTPIVNPAIVRFEVTQAGGGTFTSCVEMEFESSLTVPQIKSCNP